MTGGTLFAVTRRHGPRWRNGRAMEDQMHWDEHARFMDALHADGTVLFGGPLDGSDEVLLVVHAADAGTARRCFEGDPWSRDSILPVVRVRPWTLRVGAGLSMLEAEPT